MKPRLSHRPEAGLTLFEVGVVVALLLILIALLGPILSRSQRRVSKIGCTNNLKQVGLAFRIWEGDNGDVYPMGISITNGGSMEMVQTGNVVQTFTVMSNELSTAKILRCSEDTNRAWPTTFALLANSNVSYFIGADVTNDTNPQMIISGDCNFEVGGKPVKSGVACLWTNDPIEWSGTRHLYNGHRCGNIALADGSVSSFEPNPKHRFVETGVATNRLAIP